MPMATPSPDTRVRPHPLQPEALHPALWLGHQLGDSRAGTVASGQPWLDAELPGRGWPKRGLTELLLAHLGVGELRLVAPALAAAQRSDRLVMMFDPPAEPAADALLDLGLDLSRLLVVRSPPPERRPGARPMRSGAPVAASCWALEQALKSGHLGAVLAWLPMRLSPEGLRRLQAAAAQHDGVAFVLREPQAALRPSPAPLRLQLQPAGADRLQVQVLKRRGPPLEAPLVLALPPVLPAGPAPRTLPPAETAPADAPATGTPVRQLAEAVPAAAQRAQAAVHPLFNRRPRGTPRHGA